MLYLNINFRVHLLNLIQDLAEEAFERKMTKCDEENFEYTLQDGSELKTQQELNEELKAFYSLRLMEQCIIL